MTIGCLIKQLQRLSIKHGPRIQVCADTRTLRETCNDVWNIVNISVARFSNIECCDGDGEMKYKKNGDEKIIKCVVLE